MEAKIIEFYQSKKIPIEQIVQKGCSHRGLKESSIYEALEKVYVEYQDGKIQKDLMIAWRVWALAKEVSGYEFEKLLKTKEQLKDEIENLQKNIKGLKLKLFIAIVSGIVLLGATVGWFLR